VIKVQLVPTGVPHEAQHRDRYWPIEADGEAYTIYGGYIQRPAAIEHGKRTGYGIWDRLEQAWLVPIDFDKRVRFLEGQITGWREAIVREEGRIAEFRALQASEGEGTVATGS
jgi:hypothetical protein